MSTVFRTRRLRLSVAASVVSKATGALAQLAVTPLALAALGERRFGVFVAVTALGQWVALMGFGVMPALTRELASAQGDRRRERQLVGAGFWASIGLAGLAACVAIAVLLIIGSAGIIGHGADIAGGSVSLALGASLAIMAVQLVGGLSQALRAGFQEMHITSILTTAANLLVLAAAATTSIFQVDIAGFVIIVQAPLAVLLLADLLRIMLSRRYLLPPELPDMHALRHGDLNALSTTSGTAWLLQLHDFAVYHGSIILVSLWFGSFATASFGAAMRAVLLANSAMSLLVFPMVPAMADAWARGEHDWARISGRRLVLVALTTAVGFGGAFAIAGVSIMSAWLGHGLMWSRLTCVGFGLFFFAFSLNFVSYNLLLSLGDTRRLGSIFVVEAVAAFGLAIAFKPWLGAAGVPLALGIAAAGVSLGPLSWRLYRHLGPRSARSVASSALL